MNHRNKVLAVACLTALGIVAAPSARADLRSACMRDAFRFCTGVTPGEGRVALCLQSNRASLSTACADALSAVASCRTEIERHCRTVTEPSAIKTCLQRNDAAISDSCRRNLGKF
jgi:Cysteine rich repeat